MKRKIPLVDGEVYHIFNRSIAGYQIFNNQNDYGRMIQILKYYQVETYQKFSDFISLSEVLKSDIHILLEKTSQDKQKCVQIIAYCLMPTHIHLILKQLTNNGISKFCGDIFNSYSHYFNAKYNRKGPLWEGKFKNVLVDSDDQLLYLTRYIHLNPVAGFLIEKPEKWPYSSCNEYLKQSSNMLLCEYEDLVKIDTSYYEFLNDRISYQRELSKIKKLLLE